MTERELKENHEALWDFLAKNPDKEKGDWPGWNFLDQDLADEVQVVYSSCFACYECEGKCQHCKVRAKIGNCKQDSDCIYDKYVEASEEYKINGLTKDEEDVARYAGIIRDAWPELPEEDALDIQNLKILHEELWTWLAEHPGAAKDDWPEWNRRYKDLSPVVPHAHCFACYYDFIKRGKNGKIFSCQVCPIVEKAKKCTEFRSLWKKYSSARHNEKYQDWHDICMRMAQAWE